MKLTSVSRKLLSQLLDLSLRVKLQGLAARCKSKLNPEQEVLQEQKMRVEVWIHTGYQVEGQAVK